MGRGIGGIVVLHGVNVIQPKGTVLGVLFSIFTMGNAIGSPTVNFLSPNVIMNTFIRQTSDSDKTDRQTDRQDTYKRKNTS